MCFVFSISYFVILKSSVSPQEMLEETEDQIIDIDEVIIIVITIIVTIIITIIITIIR